MHADNAILINIHFISTGKAHYLTSMFNKAGPGAGNEVVPILNITTENALECALFCSSEYYWNHCKAFTFNKMTNMCSLIDDYTSGGAISYWKIDIE